MGDLEYLRSQMESHPRSGIAIARAMKPPREKFLDRVWGAPHREKQKLSDEDIAALYRGRRYGFIDAPDKGRMSVPKTFNKSLTGGMFGQL